MSRLLNANRFFVNQKAKLIELTNEYKIRDENGEDIGLVRQEGQTALKKAARFVSSLDAFMTHELSVYDAGGTKVCGFIRPRAFLKSRIELVDGTGRQVGRFGLKKVMAKARFEIQGADGGPLGEIRAENWRAWDFQITDPVGREIGRITKKWAGVGKELFTTADNYMVEISPDVQGDVRLILLAAAAGLDTALKQYKG